MPVFITFLWEKLPKWLQRVVIILVLLFYTPFWVREQMIQFVDTRVHAKIIPMKEQRDAEIATIKDDINDIKTDVRDIRNHLLGEKKP